MEMKTPFFVEFGTYLRNLRELRMLGLREVEKQMKDLHPDPKKQEICCISYSSLAKIERGELPPPSSLVMKTLCEIYHEKYPYMIFKAGFLEYNPLVPPQEWSLEMLSNMHFEKICIENKRRSLTEDERELVEQNVANLILTITDKKKGKK